MKNACLQFKCNQKNNKVFLYPDEQIVFGRDKNNHVKLALHPLEEISFQWATTDISRRHFTIERKEHQFFIRDAGSTNGTSVNCLAVLDKNKALEDKQIIDVGGVLDLETNMFDKNMLLKRISNSPEDSYLIFSNEFTVGTSPESCVFIGKSVRNQAIIGYKSDEYYISPSEENSNIYVDGTLIKYGAETALKKEAKISMANNNIFFKIILESDNPFS